MMINRILESDVYFQWSSINNLGRLVSLNSVRFKTNPVCEGKVKCCIFNVSNFKFHMFNLIFQYLCLVWVPNEPYRAPNI